MFFANFFFLFFPSIEEYSADGEYRDSEGQIWSQNFEWIKFAISFSLLPRNIPSGIAQVQFQHGLNLYDSHPSAFFLILHLLLEDFIMVRALEGIGTQIPHSEFTRSEEILEVKQEEGVEKVSKPPPKKRGRLQKEKIALKENPKKKAKTTVIEIEELDEEDASLTKWKEYKIKTLITIRDKMDEEFARTTN